MMTNLSDKEFLLMQAYIRDQCGILISQDKAYLIESRLAKLIQETGARSFMHLYLMLTGPEARPRMALQVLDAITTKETQWFRDKTPWLILNDLLLPIYLAELRQGKRDRVRIWSAACATGQEPYSIAMGIDQYLYQWGIKDVSLGQFEILATDLSPTALQIAQNGRYDNQSITRGLDDTCRARYFRQEGNGWVLDDRIKNAVHWRRFNLMEPFHQQEGMDIVLCRYVTVYFTEELKREVLRKIARILNPSGVLFLGNAEMFAWYKDDFERLEHKGGLYYQVRGRSG